MQPRTQAKRRTTAEGIAEPQILPYPYNAF